MRGKVAYMDRPGSLSWREFDLPTAIEPGGLLLKVLQTNICGSDVHIFEGRHPLLKCGGLGHEMVGRVDVLGPGVTRDGAGVPLAVGDRVVPMYTAVCNSCENCLRGVTNHCEHAFRYFGQSLVAPHFHGASFATHYYVHADQPFFRVPDHVSTEAAASANCALAQVLHGLDKARAGLGQRVVVQGAGGVGLLAVAVAKARGAEVIAMDPVPSRLELARGFGAEHAVLVLPDATVTQRVAQVQAVFGPAGADLVVEATGVPSVFSEGIHYLRPAGTYLVMGTITPGLTTKFDPGLLVRKSATVMGVNRYPPQYLQAALQFLSRFEATLPFGRLLGRSFPLEQALTAIEMAARREVPRATLTVGEG